jgi:hypothetical protein
MYASFHGMSHALHLGISEKPADASVLFGNVSDFNLPAVQDFGRRVFEFRIYV